MTDKKLLEIPRVSILIPVYKVPEKLLRQCLDSVVNQTLEDIEAVVVDDGSPDRCGQICDEYAKKDPRIKVIHKQNEGLSAARNTAFDAAQGEYITFLDGDDYLENDACETAYSVAKREQVQLVFWNQYTEFSHGRRLVKSMGDGDTSFSEEDCKELQIRVLDFNGRIAQAFSKLIGRSFLRKNDIRHINALKQGAEGIVFNMDLFDKLESAYYLDKPLLHYTYNENSISHTPSEGNYYLIVRCFEYIEQFIQRSQNKDKLEEKLYNRMLYIIVTTAITGYFNPVNKDMYKNKVSKFKKFLSEPLVKKSLQKANFNGVSIQRRLIIETIKLRQFWLLPILGKIRRTQLSRR